MKLTAHVIRIQTSNDFKILSYLLGRLIFWTSVSSLYLSQRHTFENPKSMSPYNSLSPLYSDKISFCYKLMQYLAQEKLVTLGASLAALPKITTGCHHSLRLLPPAEPVRWTRRRSGDEIIYALVKFLILNLPS